MSSAENARKFQGARGTVCWTDEEMLAELRASAERHGRLRAMLFLSDYERGNTALAPRSLFLRFGSWNAAARAAGFEPGYQHRKHYDRITVDECVAAVRLVADVLGAMPSIGDYDAFRACEPEYGLPSNATVRHRVGSWLKVLEMAEATRFGSEAVA